MRKTTQISLCCTAFLVGLYFGHRGLVVSWIMLAVGLGLACLLRKTRLSLIIVFALAFLSGIWRFNQYQNGIKPLQQQIGQKVTITGSVEDDPATDKYTKFTLGHLHLKGRPLAGQLAVSSPTAHVQRGYLVQVSGQLKPPFGDVSAEIFSPAVVLSSHQSWLESFRQSFMAAMRSALPPPLAGFGLGLLFGTRALIPKSLQDQLALVGLSHLVAVSGYNLTILVNAANRLLRRLGLFAATAGSAWLILGFLFIGGFSASLIRAAIVSGLTLAAGYYGRQIRPGVLILLAAALTAAWHPPYLWANAGWQLSFLAFTGILIVAPALKQRFLPKSGALTSLVTESLSAQIMTLPLVGVLFGQLSLVAPLSNALILPLVPLIMLLTAIAGVAGMFAPVISGWIAWPASLFLKLVLSLIGRLAVWRFSALSWNPSILYVLLLYVVIMLVMLIANRVVADPEKINYNRS